MEEFEALAERVTILEEEQGGTQPDDGPTDDGTYITKPGAPAIIDDAGNAYTLVDSGGLQGLQIAKNEEVDPITQHVVLLGIEQRKVVQQNQAGNWYQDTSNQSDTTNWEQIGGPPNGGGGGGGNGGTTDKYYHVNNGRILRPDGQDWKCKGPNLRFLNWPDNQNTVIQHAISDLNACTPLVTTFPGLTAVRFDAFESMAQFGVAQLSALKPYVDSIVRKGIVVEMECHVYPTLLQGNDLNQVCNWYAEIAAHYRDEPLVIFGTQNEPDGNPDEEIGRIYDAIRGTGNNTLILMCPRGGWDFGPMDPSKYRRYSNVGWDYHWYGWMSQFSTDQNYVDARLLQVWNDSQRFQSADGVIPMISGEFGPCGYNDTNGGSYYQEPIYYLDKNWLQNITAVYKAPFLNGGLQWVWNTPDTSQNNTISNLITPDGNYNGSRVTDQGGKNLQEWCRS
jgi:hypothetical protein